MNTKTKRPYVVVGSGEMTTSVYKLGDEREGFRYRFNLTRTERSTGRITHWLRPSDVQPLLKLLYVLSSELAGDGCMCEAIRSDLCRVAEAIELALDALDERRPRT